MRERESWSQSWLIALGAALACVAAVVYVPSGWPLRALATPFLALACTALVLAIRSQRRATRIIQDQQHQIEVAARLRLQVIEALSLAIDARHRTTQSIRREQRYATALARSFGMPDDEIEGVRTAALLHDVGKLAVPDHILTKPGPLDSDEVRKVRIHPQVGAGIIAGVPFTYPVASIVLCHHERWDGTGYPAGLKGNQIPLGARILACVDHYEALTSDRPFHRAISDDDAINVLWEEAGKALDPIVVARFAELLPALRQNGDEPVPREPGYGRDTLAGTDAGVEALRNISKANTEFLSLYDMSRAIGTTLGITDSMAVIAAKLHGLVPFGACALFLHEPSERTFRCRFATGPSAEGIRRLAVPVGRGVVGLVGSSRTSAVNAAPGEDCAAAGLDAEALPFASTLACPLVVSDSVVGVLALYHQDANAFTDDHQRLVHVVSEQAAAVILNSMVFEQTQVDSVTDALTGLPNIRLLFVHLSRELARASRHESPVSLLMLDLDNLKSINDTFGHSTGDHALCKVATALAGSIRPYDLCVRYGGDEFIVVLSGCGREEAESKLHELQQAIDAIVFEVAGRQRVRLAASGGAASFPDDGRSYEALLALADRRMYQDKAIRKSRSSEPGTGPGAGDVSETDLERAADGVL
jgi:diguanylate cyclase (GGDEF)-like protein